MRVKLTKAAEIGQVVRSVRKSQGIRQDDAAGIVGVSENFLGKVERGSDSLNWAKLFSVLDGLGIELWVDLPDTLSPPAEDRSQSAGHES